jgi:hypothetical protein
MEISSQPHPDDPEFDYQPSIADSTIPPSYAEAERSSSPVPLLSSGSPIPGRPYIVYSDSRYGVTIDAANKTLTVKKFPPPHSTRVIPISSILYIRRAKDVVSRLAYRDYFIGITGVNWAYDWGRSRAVFPGGWSGHRAIERSIVYKAEGDTLKSGFSVEDPEAFMTALESVVPGVTNREVIFGERDRSNNT